MADEEIKKKEEESRPVPSSTREARRDRTITLEDRVEPADEIRERSWKLEGERQLRSGRGREKNDDDLRLDFEERAVGGVDDRENLFGQTLRREQEADARTRNDNITTSSSV